MIERCTGCGRKDLPVISFQCEWPDGRTSVEQHCNDCRGTWHRQLIGLGVKLTEIVPPGAAPRSGLRLEPPAGGCSKS
jgi:hypothetical protein